MERQIKVLKVAPGEAPVPTYIKASIEAFNDAVSVGAYEKGIAAAKQLTSGIYILSYKDAYFVGLDANRRVNGKIIFGTFYVIGVTKESFPRSLTDAELQIFKTRFQLIETFSDEETMDTQFELFLAALDKTEKSILTNIYHN